MCTLACTQLGLTPAEALAACTVNAAHVLGLADRSAGSRPGCAPTSCSLDAPDWRHLAYHLGGDVVHTVVSEGRVVGRAGIIESMANQKQRRRRAKEKRHAYDLVEIDAEGNETVLIGDRAQVRGRRQRARRRSPSPPVRQAKSRGRGTPQPPSWPRVLKRGALFAPIFLATVLLLGGNRLTLRRARSSRRVFLLAVFVPFSYFMDRLVWRSHQKRQARDTTR